MTIKEVINKLKHCGVEEVRLTMEQIEKDLEVLEILKNKNIEMELLKSCVKLPDGIIRYNKIWAVSDDCIVVYKDKYLDYEEFKKIKEWLENEQIK